MSDTLKLSIIIDLDAGEARLSRKARRYFEDLTVESQITAADYLQDLHNEIGKLYEAAIEGWHSNPRLEPALNTDFGKLSLSEATEIMRQRYEAGVGEQIAESVKKYQATF